MSERTQHLVELQRVDNEVHAAEVELRGIPERQAAVKTRLAAAEAALEAARAQLASAEQEQRRLEADLQDKEALHAKLESQQTAVKTNEAYKTLLREMEHCKGAISGCEDGILDAMEAIEKTRSEVAAAEAAAKSEHEDGEAESQALAARERALADALARLRDERESVRGRLASDVLAHYDKVSARRRSAIAVVVKETCGGCRVSIPPMSVVELRRGERLVTCGNCRRILLLEDDAVARARA